MIRTSPPPPSVIVHVEVSAPWQQFQLLKVKDLLESRPRRGDEVYQLRTKSRSGRYGDTQRVGGGREDGGRHRPRFLFLDANACRTRVSPAPAPPLSPNSTFSSPPFPRVLGRLEYCAVFDAVLVDADKVQVLRVAGGGAGQEAFQPFAHQPLAGLGGHLAGHVLLGPRVHPGLEPLVQPLAYSFVGLERRKGWRERGERRLQSPAPQNKNLKNRVQSWRNR